MKTISLNEVTEFVNQNIGEFHENRINRVKKIKLREILQKKNPYLFKAKNILTAQRLIESLLQAYLSSSEEELFGDFLEELAIFVASKTHNGRKSPGSGIDLEFTRDGVVILSRSNLESTGEIALSMLRFETNLRKQCKF